MPWWCTSLCNIYTRTTLLERYTPYVCTWALCKYVREKEEKRGSKEEYFNNACHTIVCSFVCLCAHSLVCLLANSLAHSFACVFFCLWGFYSSFYPFLCSSCVCMAPLLSLDTLLVAVISFYHYVNSESKEENKKKAETSFLLYHSLSFSHIL